MRHNFFSHHNHTSRIHLFVMRLNIYLITFILFWLIYLLWDLTFSFITIALEWFTYLLWDLTFFLITFILVWLIYLLLDLTFSLIMITSSLTYLIWDLRGHFIIQYYNLFRVNFSRLSFLCGSVQNHSDFLHTFCFHPCGEISHVKFQKSS